MSDTGIPEGWMLVPPIGALVTADHPITPLNPSRVFAVHDISANQGRIYVRGEETAWFRVNMVRPASGEPWDWPSHAKAIRKERSS